jgi:hypothetical protein
MGQQAREESGASTTIDNRSIIDDPPNGDSQ